MKRRQYNATKPNCTNVRVMGYRNWLSRALPVFEESADVVYHRLHINTKVTLELFGEEAVKDLFERPEDGNSRNTVFHISSIAMAALDPKR